MVTHIMWFRKDLRLEDNTALYQALDSLHSTDKLLAIFHLEEKQFNEGYKGHDYFFSALAHFKEKVQEKNLTIHLLTGDLVDNFESLKKRFPNWQHLYFNLDNRGFGLKRDLSITAFVESLGVKVHSFEENHLQKGLSVTKEDGSLYKKFTPYYKKWSALSKPDYRQLNLANYQTQFVSAANLTQVGDRALTQLLSRRQTDFSTLVGEDKATEMLTDFTLNRLADYDKNRDFPSINGTSRLSNYLASGEISIRKVYHSVNQTEYSLGKETFIKELAWRDFYHMIYLANPKQYKEELIEKYRELPWQNDLSAFTAWQNGNTGFPIIDAAMRQLKETGWMHNRLRMLTASFLTKDLLIDWRLGERYFAKQLIDYDSASNIGGWQWAASTGTDAAPYFRVFNPTTQSQKFDSDGAFIKQYVPELKNLPIKYLHEPSKLPEALQKELDFKIGASYPLPMVNHNDARKRALAFFSANIDNDIK